ncbi:MAG: hypothetical protein FJZ15_07055 [Candidatus Omnitrophica bacterium]|nr:hypothetical protein [Candidatus Omnitrophota bacterium]
MAKKINLTKYLAIAVTLAVGILFVIKFAGPQLLKLYITAGYGTCKENPVLCMAPSMEIIKTRIDRGYIAKLVPFKFPEPKTEVYMPLNFTVYKGEVKEAYFKKLKRTQIKQVAYLLYRKPNFFVNLFPQITKGKIQNDYDFLKKVMNANINSIKDITDAFFVIMKCIFIPDMGDQKNLIMAEFTLGEKRGFINYNLTPTVNYYDCNLINNQCEFFKLYIKDTGATLDLDKVFAIISTIESDTIGCPREIDGKNFY